MLPKMPLLLVTLLLAGGTLTVAATNTAPSCATSPKDDQYTGPYAPDGAPAFTAPAKGYYYYLGTVDSPPVTTTGSGATSGVSLVRPLTLWHEHNLRQGLQVRDCIDSDGGMWYGKDTEIGLAA